MDSKPIYLSKEGIARLEKELKELKTEKRPKLVGEIKRAAEMGDLSENAEYHAAKEAQQVLEGKIAELEDKLSRVQPVDTNDIPTDKAYLFAKVLVKDLADDEEEEFTLAPPDETDVDNNVISVESPIGKGLLGHAIGDIVEIKVPSGLIKFEIMKISRD
jgi:transcription elongation factor GreA